MDEAYLEFLVPLPNRRNNLDKYAVKNIDASLHSNGRHTIVTGLNNDNIHAADRKNVSYNDGNRYGRSNSEEETLFPSQFGVKKAKELRERIFRETGCTAR